MERLVSLKTSLDIAGLRRACRAAASILAALEELIEPGVTTLALDSAARGAMRCFGAEPAVAAGFPGSICASVNEVAAHGIPSSVPLRAGDLVSVDVSLVLEGWCGDAACTFAVGSLAEDRVRLWTGARAALAAGIAAMRAGGHLGDVGAAIVRQARRHGCTVIPDLVGHGVGRELHEEPQVFPTGKAGKGARIVPGMVLTVEPALTLGSPRVVTRDDGWSLATADGAPVAQFEHTVAVFLERTEVLTALDPAAPSY